MTIVKPKWDQALPSQIYAVLVEYDDIFPYELPLGLSPMHQGRQFKINLEDDVPPIYHPLYKMSSLELEVAKKQIESMLEHGFMRPLVICSPWYLLVVCVWDIVGLVVVSACEHCAINWGFIICFS